MNQSTLYWITRLNHVCVFIEVTILCLFAIIIICSLVNFSMVSESFKADLFIEWYKILIATVILLFFGIVRVFIPDTKEMAFIILAPKIANNEFVKEIPSDMLEIKNLAMQYIRENLQKEKK